MFAYWTSVLFLGLFLGWQDDDGRGPTALVLPDPVVAVSTRTDADVNVRLLRGALPREARGEARRQGHRPELSGIAGTHADRVRFGFFRPDDEHVRIPRKAALRILAPSLSLERSTSTRRPWDRRRSTTRRAWSSLFSLTVSTMACLRRDPGGKLPPQCSSRREEALERPEDGSVEHDRSVLLAVLPRERKLEPCRQVRVVLDRAELPGAFQRVVDVELDLRVRRRPLARDDLVLHPRALEALPERRSLRQVPLLVGADALVGAAASRA
jgi:hypothetical protein